jgi:hypothetical protein
VDYLKANPDKDFVVCYGLNFLSPEANLPAPPPTHTGLVKGYAAGCFLGRTAVFEKVGHFDLGTPVGCDTEWFMRARDLNISEGVLPEVLMHRRLHGKNLSLLSSQEVLLRLLRQSIVRKRHLHKASSTR